VRSVLELGCGQGRDTFLFVRNGLEVTALDYSNTAITALNEKAIGAELSSRIHAHTYNVKGPLPFPDDSFDACYSHMLLCMELSTAEIAFILREIHRILRPGGLAVYSVRSNFDKHYRTGTHLGEDIYEIGGFVIHFFSEEKVKKLAKGYEILEINRMEEGSLPRDLYIVTMKKTATPVQWDLEPCEEIKMSDPFGKFQVFMDATLAPGALDHKTKQLVALGAALAAGCDP
jgi:SAM-dependent methyltransferase